MNFIWILVGALFSLLIVGGGVFLLVWTVTEIRTVTRKKVRFSLGDVASISFIIVAALIIILVGIGIFFGGVLGLE